VVLGLEGARRRALSTSTRGLFPAKALLIPQPQEIELRGRDRGIDRRNAGLVALRMRVVNVSDRSYIVRMSSFLAHRSLLLVAVLVFIGNAMILPAVRLRLRHGHWGIAVASTRDPVQRLMGSSLAIASLGVVAWSILYATVDASVLGIWTPPDSIRAIGWLAMLLGFLVVVAAQADMGASWRVGIDPQTTALVTSGLYRVVRNPIYSGMIVTYFGFVLVTPASWTVMTFLMIVLVIELQTRLEEKHLEALHGAAYLEYASAVGRFFPGVGRLRRS
jgi:protein-S-isoprenylcysteine O-methyltransferase Ste14